MNPEKVVVTISSRIVGETGDFLRAAGPFLYLAAYTRSHGLGDAVMITLLWMINSFPFQMVTLLGTILLMAKRQMATGQFSKFPVSDNLSVEIATLCHQMLAL